MENVIQLLKSNFYQAGRAGIGMELVAVAILFLLLVTVKEKNRYVIFVTILAIMVLNPLSYNNITTFWFQDEYWKIFSILTPVVVVAYAFARLVTELKGKVARCLMAAVCIFLVALSVRFEFDDMRFEMPENMLGVSAEIIELSEVLQTSEIPLVGVIAPREVIGSIREVNASISLLYGENLIREIIAGNCEFSTDGTRTFAENCASIVAAPSVVENQINVADLYGSNCIILEPEYDDNSLMERRGFGKIGETDAYIVYVRK